MLNYQQLDENIKGVNVNDRVYIHRYSVAFMLGLIYTDSKTKSSLVRWDRFKDYYDNSLEEFHNLYPEEEIGFSDQNIPSSQSNRSSKIELSIPEYINSDMVYTLSFVLKTEKAKQFRFALTKQVIPFFKQNASPEQINSIPIMSEEVQFENLFRKDIPLNLNRFRSNQINLMINSIRHMASRINLAWSVEEVYNKSFSILDSIVQSRTNGVCLNTLVIDLKQGHIRGIGNHLDILECVYHNSLLFDDMMASLNQVAVDLEKACVENDNNNIHSGKYTGVVKLGILDVESGYPIPYIQQTITLTGNTDQSYTIGDYTITELDILQMAGGSKIIPADLYFNIISLEDPGKEVVKFAPTSDIYPNPSYYHK